MEEDFPINMTAVLVTVVATFIFGYVWYTLLFGKAWAKEMKVDMSVKPAGGEMARGMIFMVIGNFFFAYVLASNNAAWSYVPGIENYSMMQNVMSAAGFTWLGFFLPGDLSRVGWEKHSWKLFGINTGYHLINLIIAATILMSMPR